MWLRDIAFCITFFTRLPVQAPDFGDRKLADAIWAAPLAGLLVGLIGAAIYSLATLCDLWSGSAAALALAATMVSTGCLHEDGLCDTADGFGGGRDRQRKLEIMRDSRIGTYGAAALALSILIRWSAVHGIGDVMNIAAALIVAHVASRAILPAFMTALPSARPQGLSASAGTVATRVSIVAAAIGFVALFVLGVQAALIAAALLLVAFLLFRSLCIRQVGGQTGDTLGALQQIAEAAVLLTASALL